jgi:hypothetical protein
MRNHNIAGDTEKEGVVAYTHSNKKTIGWTGVDLPLAAWAKKVGVPDTGLLKEDFKLNLPVKPTIEEEGQEDFSQSIPQAQAAPFLIDKAGVAVRYPYNEIRNRLKFGMKANDTMISWKLEISNKKEMLEVHCADIDAGGNTIGTPPNPADPDIEEGAEPFIP